MEKTCHISGKPFTVTEHEVKLRTHFEIDGFPAKAPKYRFRELGAFWPHWNLHKRKCDKTGQDIVSVFRPDCPYPVWHKDVWMKEADPPKAAFDFDRPFFDQAWKLFQKCPIFHRITAGCENCEFTDDWWYSRNCYLCHSGVDCESLRYCYRCLGCKDMMYGVFSYESEQCVDVINCIRCFGVIFGLECKDVRDSAFTYDCRNCSDCMFCFNLRSKSYCIGNQQYSKEEYETLKKKWNLASRKGYQEAKALFAKMMGEIAWHRATYINKSENTHGNYLENVSDMTNAFYMSHQCENCANVGRGGVNVKTALDTWNIQSSEEVIYSCGVQDKCYNIQYSHNVQESRGLKYCGYVLQSENCFGCCGLLKGKFSVLNTAYSKQEYEVLATRIIDHMKSTKEWGRFFPGYFSPNPYDESYSATYWPMSPNEQKDSQLFYQAPIEKENAGYQSTASVPDSWEDSSNDISSTIFWDEKAQRPFQILDADITMCRALGISLPHTYYTTRTKENLAWMPFDGELRTTTCAKSGKTIQTSWPDEYDGRILCEEEYLKVVN